MRSKGDSGLEDRTVEQDDVFGRWVRGVTEVVDVAVWAQAADDGGAGRGIHGLPLGSDGDFAVVADTHGGLLAPDKKPPWAGGHGPQDGAVFGQRLLPRGLGRHPSLQGRGGLPIAVADRNLSLLLLNPP